MNDSIYEPLIRIFLNSFLIFAVACAVIVGSLFFLNVKNPRKRALLRSIPILKLPLDLFVYKLISWDGLAHFYVFGCKGYIKLCLIHLFPTFFPLDMDSNNFPSVAHAIYLHVPAHALTLFLGTILAISAALTARKGYFIYQSLKQVKQLLGNSTSCLRPISNLKLLAALSKTRTHVYQSAEIHIPLATASGAIVLPKRMVQQLSQVEFEAVLAHELEHIKWRDAWVRMGCEVIQAVFWWLPMPWLIKKIEEEQEQASDLSMKSYQIDKEVLMSAIYKVVKHYKETRQYACCSFMTQPSCILRRLQKILETDTAIPQNCFTTNVYLSMMVLAIIAMRCCIC